MNSKILVVSLVALLIFFSGCVAEEAEALDEEFTAFVGTWYWDSMNIDPENPVLYGKDKYEIETVHFSEEENLNELLEMYKLNKIKFTINADGTGRYMEFFSEGADFECAAIVEISQNDLSIYCKMLSVSREFSIIEEPSLESSNPKMVLEYDSVDGEMIFARIN